VLESIHHRAAKTSQITGLIFDRSIQVADFLAGLSESIGTVQVYSADGSSLMSSSDNLGTGMQVKVTSGTQSKTYTVVIYGDINGDGLVNIVDFVKMKRHILYISRISDTLQFQAANIKKQPTKDVSVIDLVYLKRHILGLNRINQD
jgi:hypothetical protein